MIYTGKCSTFGGPQDAGVALHEGLALIDPVDMAEHWFNRLFLPHPVPGLGMARSLNPLALYCAMRFAYELGGEVLPGVSRRVVRRGLFRVTANSLCAFVQAADWGPAKETGRVIDLSPGAAQALCVKTDDIVTIEPILGQA